MNAYTMMLIVRGLIGERSAAHWTKWEVLDAMNRAYRWVWLKLLMSQGNWFVTYSDLTPVASEVTLPDDCFNIIYAEVKSTEEPIILTQGLTVRQRTRTGENTRRVGKLTAYLVKNKLIINKAAYTTQIRLWYQQRLTPLHLGTAGTGSTTNKLVLDSEAYPSRTDDYYNDETVEVIDGTGTGISSSISDYDGSGYYATISGTPASGDHYGTVLQTPEEANNVIPLKAAAQLVAKPTSALSVEQVGLISHLLQSEIEVFEAWRNMRIPRGVNINDG